MNEKFDYKDSLTDIKASLFDIYEDQERVIGSIDPDLRDKHVSEFIEVKDLALSLLEKIQKLYDNSLVPVKDNNEEVQVNNEDVKNIKELVSKIEKYATNDEVEITYLRQDKIYNTKIQLEKNNNSYKTGIYVKDNLLGNGTLTYIDPETKIYGALGHRRQHWR